MKEVKFVAKNSAKLNNNIENNYCTSNEKAFGRLLEQIEIHNKNIKYEMDQFEFYESKELYNQFMVLNNNIKECRKCTKREESSEKYLINPFNEFKEEKYLLPFSTNYWTDLCFHIIRYSILRSRLGRN